ncbi:hypothetical protein, partial [Escherichia coli]|uniref:hypothetical protein n=1 Tax=Escherichia coli TaxID=562 RepID=UPI0035937992
AERRGRRDAAVPGGGAGRGAAAGGAGAAGFPGRAPLCPSWFYATSCITLSVLHEISVGENGFCEFASSYLPGSGCEQS